MKLGRSTPLPKTDNSFTVSVSGDSALLFSLTQGPSVHWGLWAVEAPELGCVAPLPGPMPRPTISALRPLLTALLCRWVLHLGDIPYAAATAQLQRTIVTDREP